MTGAEAALLKRIEARARKLRPELAARELAAYRIIKNGLSPRELEAAIRGGSVERFIGEVLNDGKLDPAFAPLRALVDRAVLDSARVSLKDLPGKLSTIGFDVLNPRVVEAARKLDTNVITGLKTELRDTFRGRIRAGLEAGEGPASIARDLRSIVGLAPNQERAVANFRAMLEAGDREALSRAWRDRRYDGLLNRMLGANGGKIPSAKIDTMVNAYQRKALASNAATHARTAALDAQKIGQKLSIDDAIERGILDPERMIKTWVSVDDDKVRPEHAAMDGEEVPYDEPFSNGQDVPGESDWNCRCVARYEQARSADDARKRVAASREDLAAASAPAEDAGLPLPELATAEVEGSGASQLAEASDESLVEAAGEQRKPFEGIRPGETPEEFQRRRRRERAIERRKRKKIEPPPPPKPEPPPPLPPEPVIEPKPVPPEPVDPKLRRPGETEEEFQKRRRKERRAARELKKKGINPPKPKPEPGPGPKPTPPRPAHVVPDLDEAERRMDRVQSSFEQKINEVSGRRFKAQSEVDRISKEAREAYASVVERRKKAYYDALARGETPRLGMVSDDPVVYELEQKRFAAQQRLDAIQEEYNAVMNERRDAMLEKLVLPKEERSAFKSTLTKIAKTARQDVVDGVEGFRSVVPKKYLDGKNINIKTIKGRAFFNAFSGAAVPAHGGRYTIEVTAHELGHWLERAEPRVGQAARDFLNKRTVGEQAVKLKSLLKGHGYGTNEIAKPDGFYDPYVGKIYGHGATEIFSMGIEAFLRDPYRFYQLDREHFKLILELMRGAF